MRTYDVSWTQGHRAEVKANNKEDAKTIALHLHDLHSFVCARNISVKEVIR